MDDCAVITPLTGIMSTLSVPVPSIKVSASFFAFPSSSCGESAPLIMKSPINEEKNATLQRKKNIASEVAIQKPTLLFFLLSFIVSSKFYSNSLSCLFI